MAVFDLNERTAVQKFSINSNWILKKDGNRIILYLLSNFDSTYLSLTTAAGVILSLFDGRRTLKEVTRIVEYLFECDPGIAKAYVAGLLESLQDDEKYPIVARHPIIAAEASPVIRSDLKPLDYVVPSNPQPSSRLRLHSPLSLMIFFTNACQTDCRYCYAERASIKRSDLLSIPEWQQILEQARELEIRKVTVTGGDVFARRDGIDFIELLLRYNLLFLISTKCLIPKEYARRLEDAGFCDSVQGVYRDVQISLDSCNPDIAAFLTGRKNYLSRARLSIRNLVEAGITPKVKAVLTPYNIHELERFVREMSLLKVNRINFSRYEPTFYRHSDDLSLAESQKRYVRDCLLKLVEQYPEMEFDGDALSEIQDTASPEEDRMKWQKRAGCSGGRSEMGITAHGKVVLCEQTPQSPPFIFGDIRKNSILEIWNSPSLLNFIYPRRDSFAQTACFECSEFDQCQYELGNCFRDAFFATGNPFEASPMCPYREKIPRVGNWRL